MFKFLPAKTISPSIGTLTILASTVLSGCATNYDVPAIRIDSDLRITPVGHRSLYGTTVGERYTIMHGYWITSIDHQTQRAGQQQPERLLYLETRPDGVLDRTVKTQKILQGDFGSLFSERQCSYREPLNQGASTVGVSWVSNEYSPELPGPFQSKPATLPLLTSISVVRVFHSAPGYLVVVTNYEPNERIGSFSLTGGESGNETDGNFAPQDPRLDRMKQFGIPLRLSLDRLAQNHRIEFTPSAMPEVTSLAVEHYGFDEWVQVDVLHDGIVVSSSFLRSAITEEEKVLTPICNERFKRQQAQGMSTVF